VSLHCAGCPTSDEAHAWIAEHLSPAPGRTLVIKVSSKQMETLDPPASRCPRAAESDKFPEELRELLYGSRKNKYRIIFAIRNKDVVVLYVHHAARNELEP